MTTSEMRQTVDILSSLCSRLEGEVDDSTRRRAEYSSDASNYRVVPLAVIFPRSDSDVVAIVEEARRTGTPVTARGAGTSVAGNAVGPGLVVDFSRHMNAVLEVDPVARTARVQPGVVMSTLQAAAAPYGLRFGPDPSTQARCTIGGMVGNNACGPRAVAWGRTVDNVRELRIVDGRARVLDIGQGFDAVPDLEEFTRRHLATIRTEFGLFGRQVSGYSLEHLLPERKRDVAKALVGTEGTCGMLLSATVSLVEIPAATALTVLAYDDMPTAADDVTRLLPLKPLAIESMDSYLLDVVVAHHGADRVPALPTGGAWLFVETSGLTMDEALARAEEVRSAATASSFRIVPGGPVAKSLWRIREDGVGLAGRTPDGEPAWPGWEDAAVPPAVLGAYLRDFDALKQKHGVTGLSYGHVGDGCIHTRLDLPIADAPDRFRRFLEDSADLVVSYGGSLSGEHGDGRARGDLLSRMYSPEAIEALGEFKAIFDPEGILNPGIIVKPLPLDADLRLLGARPTKTLGLALIHDRGDLSRAVHRCVGVGKCRADNSASGGFMCPSYLATRDEKDSTRGRARVLQEMINGSLVGGGWDSPEVEESLDLCLSCKACGSDCPAGVDMATYKSEVLYRKYQGRLRPASHYALGWLPLWLRLAALAPRIVNLLASIRPLRTIGMRLAGVDVRREVPAFATRTFRSWWRSRSVLEGRRPRVVLWMDSFTNGFSPEIGRSAITVLEDAGYEVVLTRRQECCGLTWISTGQLDGARRLLQKSVDALTPFLEEGLPIVGLEPSCTAVLRSDLLELLPDDPRSKKIASNTFTLAEFLAAPRAPHSGKWSMPSLEGVGIVVQPHCHQHAIMGFEIDKDLMVGAGAEVTSIAGCCGLAGNFGMEQGHYDVSVAVAENGLLPALRASDPENTVFLADGFSCRTQADQLARREGRHLADLIAERLKLR
jgi:FAD/FMN-containing dehydrogenase/Fe-S oxidoreductase